MDHREIEEKRWIGDDVIRDLGEAGLCGLYVDEQYGGQGLSQTGYARVFETFAQIDATLSIVLGVHQSIGFKGIHMFGTDEQKERFLPDLAAGRKLAGFALTEPEAGSDAYEIKSRAVAAARRLLGAERREALHRQRLEGRGVHRLRPLRGRRQGPPHRADPREGDEGLRGRRALRHDGPARQRPAPPATSTTSRCPAENVLGEPGDGFRIAMQVLNNGRIGLGTGSVGATKHLIDLAIDHVKERRQFGRPLADFELVQDKIALDGLLPVRARVDVLSDLRPGRRAGSRTTRSSRRSARSSGTEFLWYAANRAMQLKGGAGYMRDEPYEKILRDIRIFPIFEGANDVMRAFIALSGMKPVGEKLSGLGEIGLGDPIGSIGVLADYVGGRIRSQVRPDRIIDGPPGALSSTPTRSPTRSASCAR